MLPRVAFGLAVAATTVWAYAIPSTGPEWRNREMARILFFHLPFAILAPVLLLVGGYFGLRYLRSEQRTWDVRSAAIVELGFIFGLITMATGMLFSKVQWGTWWQWDPRQYSFLIVLLIYAAYFALRSAFSDDGKRAASSAVYALASALPMLFLVFVFPRLPQIQALTFHPNQTILRGDIKGSYAQVLTAMMVLIGIAAVWLYRLRVRAGLLELALEDFDANTGLDSRGDPTPTSVVRPVSIPGEGGRPSEEG